MQPFRFLAVSLLFAAGWSLAIGEDARAADATRRSVPSKQTDETSTLVEKALLQEVEVDGTNDQRSKILQGILEETPDHAPARWHSGHVWFSKQWLDYRQFPKALSLDKRMSDYWKIRERCKDEPDHQFKLGQWCFDRKLVDQARAHWTRVLDLDPENEQTHQRLGHQNFGEEWLSGEQLDEGKEFGERQKKAMTKWGRELQGIWKGLQSKSPGPRAHAKKRLLEIDDPSIVVPLVSMLAGQDEEAEQLLVEVLGKIETAESSAVLARLAVMSPWRPVRTAAARQLHPRKMDDYVPLLLAMASTEIESRFQWVSDAGQMSVYYRHLFFREGQDRKEMAALNRAYQVSPQSVAPNADMRDCMKDAAASAKKAELWREEQNVAIREINERIFEAIYEATGQRLPVSPADWWKWWNDLNEVYVTGEKKVVGYAKNEQIQVSSTVVGPPGGAAPAGQGGKGGGVPPGATSSPGSEFRPCRPGYRAQSGRDARPEVPMGPPRSAPKPQKPEQVQPWQQQQVGPQPWQMAGRGGAWQQSGKGGAWQMPWHGGAWQKSGGGGAWQQAGRGGQWQQDGGGGQWQQGGAGQKPAAPPADPVPEKKEEPKPPPPEPPPKQRGVVGPVRDQITTEEMRTTKSTDAASSGSSKSPSSDPSRPPLASPRAGIEAIVQKSRTQKFDCLAPGTQVWTESGLYAIEEIQVGDLVLSQDVETGRLHYKPVLRVTVRPKGMLLQIKVGDEAIESSGGHPFWVSGQGWVKARDLKPGMRLHCVTGIAEVKEVVDESSEKQTHNLVVADFHTYFIGKAKTLTHDNSTRTPTQSIVPGLAKR